MQLKFDLNIRPGNSLVPDDSRFLSDLILTYNQVTTVAFSWVQEILRVSRSKMDLKLHILKTAHRQDGNFAATGSTTDDKIGIMTTLDFQRYIKLQPYFPGVPFTNMN